MMKPFNLHSKRQDGPNWQYFGLSANPFPASGITSSILYAQHMPSVIQKLEKWLGDALQSEVGTPRGPFALEGTIGAGKTHLLAAIERQLQQDSDIPSGVLVIRGSLADGGGGRLLLSTLFSSNLPLKEIVEQVLSSPQEQKSIALTQLPSASPIREAFSGGASPEIITLWLRGSPLTGKQSQSVGGRALEAEGERLRATIHLLRLAAHIGHLRVVVFLLDQLEDLERKSEITPLRRARFLTDLRIFIDEGLEGAPVALCMAWNTEGTRFMEGLRTSYPALASRLGEEHRAMVPGLPRDHLLAFANAYINEAYEGNKNIVANARLEITDTICIELMKQLKLQLLPGEKFAPREWLDVLRKWADDYVGRVPPNKTVVRPLKLRVPLKRLHQLNRGLKNR